MNTTLMIGQFVPIVILAILTLTLIEAAGAGTELRKLPGIDQRQQTSAKIMQRSNLIIMPLVFASFLTGTLASYEQNPAMYGTFTLINGMLGASVFFFHCTGNERVTLVHYISIVHVEPNISGESPADEGIQENYKKGEVLTLTCLIKPKIM